MFLDQWLGNLEKWSFVLAVAGYIVGGICIGCFSWRWRRFFFFLSTFLVLFFEVRTRVQGSMGPWVFVALGGASVMAFWRQAERVGRFVLGFWLVSNLVALLFLISRDVDVIRFLTRIPWRILFWVALIGGVFALSRSFLRFFGAFVGSALVIEGYLKIIARGGFADSFWGEPPLVIFLFLITSVGMYALGERE